MKPVKFGQIVSFAVLTGTVAFSCSGCASSSGKKVVPHSHSGQMFRTQFGTVIGVREVVIEGSTETGVGQWGGAMIGGAAGAAATGGTGGVETIMASSVAAVGGMIAGREIEKAVTKADGYEITVELEDGSQVMVVQEMNKGEFYDGDKVRVMIGTNTTEIMH